MNYANIKYYDIANGPGVRTSVFVSGCRHHCPGCFNAVAWDFDYGQPFDKTVLDEVFASCQPDYIAGLSLLGGEPFEPENQRELPCASAAAATSACWMCPSPLPPGSPCGGRTKRYSPPIPWNGERC